jgi:glycosyltransferase involved in cell wall biosynthesis
MNKARVSVIRHGYYPRDAHVKKHVEALVEAGFAVDVYCLREPGEAATARDDGASIYRLPVAHRRKSSRRYVFEYLAFMLLASALLFVKSLRRKYDIVEVYNVPDVLLFAALPARLRGSKVIFYFFEFMPEQTADVLGVSMKHPFIRLMLGVEALCTRFADHVMTWSPYSREVIVQRCLPEGKPLTMVLNVADSKVFYPRPRPAEATRAFRLFTHGSVLERYGIQTVIQAVPLLRAKVPHLQVRILGDGEYRPNLQQLAEDLGVTDVVEFVDWVPFAEVPEQIAQADVCLVLTSAPWLLPNKLFEYAAMQKPVVAADSPTLRSVYGDSAVWYFTPSDHEDLANQVLALYARDEERAARVDAAYAYFLQQQWAKAKEVYVGVHDQLLDRPRIVAASARTTINDEAQ